MTLGQQLKALIASKPNINWAIDRISDTSYGCRYVWDGLMNCHVVLEDGQYVDVQDVPDDWDPSQDTGHGLWEDWNRFPTLEAYVESIERMIASHS